MTTLSVKPFTSILKPRSEVMEGRIEEAVNLANMYLYNELRDKHPEARELIASSLYNSQEFLKRTHISEEIKNIILIVMGGLARVSNVYLDEKGSRFPVSKRIIVVPSALGGGKTHLLATLYHIAKLYNEKRERIVEYFEDQKLRHGLLHVSKTLNEYGDIRIIAIVGDTHALAPTPDEPLVINGYRIHTPWGLLGYLLGEYGKLKNADELHKPPDVDVLRSILRNKTVLILIDEAVEYMVKAVRLDARYPGYSEAFLSFIRNLAMAVDETPGSVLVVTLPAEFREGYLEKGYQHPEYVERINSMLQRVGPEYHPPLAFEKDISAVFKKRLFENADSIQVKENARIIAELIRDRVNRDSVLQESIKNKYGDVHVFVEKLRDTYPFHPYFVELLINIAMRNPGLGLTRYLLAFVARLVKYTYDLKERHGRDPLLALIAPWIIPIERTEFRVDLLRGMISQIQSEFQRIYEQDVISYSKRLDELIYVGRPLSREEGLVFTKASLARTIWLSTIPGQGSKSSEAIKLYLQMIELPAVIHDPLAMRAITGADVINALKELKDVSTYLTVSHDDRVFYALIPDILAILRQRYLGTTDFHALSKLEQLIQRKSFRPGRLIKNVIPIYTSREKEIEEMVEKEIEKNSDPALVIYLGLEDPPPNILDYVLKRNNIVLLLPDLSAAPQDLGLHYIEKFRRILGNEPPTTKEYIKSILKLLRAVEDLRNERDYLKEFVGEENIDYVYRILEDIRRELEKHLFISIYTVLRKAVSGVQKKEYEVDLRPFEEEVKDLSILSRYLEESLEKKGVLTKWDWSDIANQLREWTDVWDIDYSIKKPIRVGDLWSQLLYSTSIRPHLTSFEDFKNALENAYLNNLVAFRYNNLIMWLKHPYTPGEAEKLLREKSVLNLTLHDWERDVIGELQRNNIKLIDTEMISPRVIIREYVQKLRKLMEVKPGEKTIKRLVVYTPSGQKEFDEFIASLKSDIEVMDALSRYPVVLIEEKPKRIFDLIVLNVNDKPFRREELPIFDFDQKGELKVYGQIRSEEKFNVKISLEIRDMEDKLIGNPEEKIITAPSPFELMKTIKKPGEYIVVLKAEEPGGFKHPTIPIARVRVKGEICVERRVKANDLRSILEQQLYAERIELRTVEIKGILKKFAVQSLHSILKELSHYGVHVSGSVEVTTRDGVVKVEFKNTNTDIASKILVAIGLEDMEVDIKLSDLSIDILKRSRQSLGILLEPSHLLSTIVEFTIHECRRV